MTMKKILASVLAAASMLSISAVAFAASDGVAAPDKNKAVTKPGEAEYEVGVSALKCELDVELPGSMKAFLNPYGATVKVEDKATGAATTSQGVVSWAYEVINNTADYGIWIDVKNGKATVSNDKMAIVTPTTAVLAGGANNAAGFKKVSVEMVAATDTANALPVLSALKTASASCSWDAATTSVKQGAFVFTDSEASQVKVAYAKAKGTATNATAQKVYLGITGQVAKKTTEAGGTTPVDIEWTEDDTIALTYILKISPAPAVAAAADFT